MNANVWYGTDEGNGWNYRMNKSKRQLTVRRQNWLSVMTIISITLHVHNKCIPPRARFIHFILKSLPLWAIKRFPIALVEVFPLFAQRDRRVSNHFRREVNRRTPMRAKEGSSPVDHLRNVGNTLSCAVSPPLYKGLTVFLESKVLCALFWNLHSLPVLPLSPLECKFQNKTCTEPLTH